MQPASVKELDEHHELYISVLSLAQAQDFMLLSKTEPLHVEHHETMVLDGLSVLFSVGHSLLWRHMLEKF